MHAIATGRFTASTAYFILSDEQVSGDIWGEAAPVTGTAVATVNGQVYTDGFGVYQLVGGTGGSSYVPPNFLYH
jgi:hypothetical protein